VSARGFKLSNDCLISIHGRSGGAARSAPRLGLLLASSAIHCRFVDRFVGLRVPSRVFRQWVLSVGNDCDHRRSIGFRGYRLERKRPMTHARRAPNTIGPGDVSTFFRVIGSTFADDRSYLAVTFPIRYRAGNLIRITKQRRTNRTRMFEPSYTCVFCVPSRVGKRVHDDCCS
jgi:hypothetical protein